MYYRAIAIILLVSIGGCTQDIRPDVKSGRVQKPDTQKGKTNPLDQDPDSTDSDDRLYGKEITQTIVGGLVKVVDGDTIEIVTPRREHVRVPLASVDAPELTQPFGQRAAKYLESLTTDRLITVKVTGKDDEGGISGWVITYPHGDPDASSDDNLNQFILGKVNVNVSLLDRGLAWHDKESSDSDELSELETDVKKLGIGLWADRHPVAPWAWRTGIETIEPNQFAEGSFLVLSVVNSPDNPLGLSVYRGEAGKGDAFEALTRMKLSRQIRRYVEKKLPESDLTGVLIKGDTMASVADIEFVKKAVGESPEAKKRKLLVGIINE